MTHHTHDEHLIWSDRLDGLQERMRQHMEEGALTDAYQANREEVIALLNRALASEWSAFLQYMHHHFMVSDIYSASLRDYFKDAAMQELHHAEEIAERIQQLGGVPCAKPEEIIHQSPTAVEYGHDIRSMLEADLSAERATIVFYSDIVRYCGDDDITTRRLFEHILAEEEEHADDLATLLYAQDASTGQPIGTTTKRMKTRERPAEISHLEQHAQRRVR